MHNLYPQHCIQLPGSILIMDCCKIPFKVSFFITWGHHFASESRACRHFLQLCLGVRVLLSHAQLVQAWAKCPALRAGLWQGYLRPWHSDIVTVIKHAIATVLVVHGCCDPQGFWRSWAVTQLGTSCGEGICSEQLLGKKARVKWLSIIITHTHIYIYIMCCRH